MRFELRRRKIYFEHTGQHVPQLDDRPARNEQVTVAAGLQADVLLEDGVARLEVLAEQRRLIIASATLEEMRDLLQQQQIGIFVLNHLDDALQAVAPIVAADSFVDVVAEKPHRLCEVVDQCRGVIRR